MCSNQMEILCLRTFLLRKGIVGVKSAAFKKVQVLNALMVEWSNGQKMVKLVFLVKYFEINAANKGLEGWMTDPETLKASDI